MRALSYLISGVLVYGLLGWLGDHALGTRFLLPIGIVVGAGFGVYVIIKRYSQPPDLTPGPAGTAKRGPAMSEKTAVGKKTGGAQ